MPSILIQNSAGSVTLFLQNDDGTAATGLEDTDVTADIKKAGAGSFSSFTLSPSNWSDLGGGFYEVSLEDSDTNVLGNLHLRVQGAGIKTGLTVAFVVASAPVSPPAVTVPDTVSIFGYVYDVDASPLAGASVTARLLGAPAVLHPGGDGIVVSQGLVTTETDNDGFFSVELISGTNVDVVISAAQYRRTLLVPSTSENLFDIP